MKVLNFQSELFLSFSQVFRKKKYTRSFKCRFIDLHKRKAKILLFMYSTNKQIVPYNWNHHLTTETLQTC